MIPFEKYRHLLAVDIVYYYQYVGGLRNSVAQDRLGAAVGILVSLVRPRIEAASITAVSAD